MIKHKTIKQANKAKKNKALITGLGYRHPTKWSVNYIRTGIILHFDTLEECKIIAFQAEGITPVSIRPPLYYEE